MVAAGLRVYLLDRVVLVVVLQESVNPSARIEYARYLFNKY